MRRLSTFLIILFISQASLAQADFYVKSIKAYQKKYVAEHEVVKGKDKKYFHFFPISSAYNVTCSFEKIIDTIGFTMKTSANTLKHYFKYGRLSFKMAGTDCRLFVYQSKELMQTEKYRNYLFIPFTDATTGDESYGSGRYIEFYIADIQNNILQLDFNKAYNPYCAYSAGYKCPIPPKENGLTVAVKAGEMNFGKAH
jgi:uncharacterized protein